MADSLQLAITTIGDLLLKEIITRDSNGSPIANVNLTIPDYQRPYKWTAKNVNQLFDDILDAKYANKEIYRVGTLILHKEAQQYEIVDGQQRTITFALLLKALNADTIDFFNQSLSDNAFNKRNIPNNYRILKRRADNLAGDQDRQELLEYIENHCELIVVITDDLSEAFQFFDSQNARGKKLYPHDLLKAYHLREMRDLDTNETEKVVKLWEDMDQQELASLFSNYLYRLKKWIKGKEAQELTEQNIDQFKGVTKEDRHPYAMFYKGAFAYADSVNHSTVPFVTGLRHLKPFQLDTPIIAGKPFFDYSKYYFDILKDIQNNDKYEGYYINDNDIIKTVNLYYKHRTGDKITRLLLDTAILLYVDRFCPERPSKSDSELLDRFFVFAFIWAYSLRAQYIKVGWQTAQNYILKEKDLKNSFNLYRVITESDSPISLLNILTDRINPLSATDIKDEKVKIDGKVKIENIDAKDENGVFQNYLYHFKSNRFLEDKNEK